MKVPPSIIALFEAAGNVIDELTTLCLSIKSTLQNGEGSLLAVTGNS